MGRLLRRLGESKDLFVGVATNPALRRLEGAWACSIVGTWAFTVGVMVFAYEHAGAGGVGLVGLVRWVAAGFVSPFAALLGDRYDRRLVMIASDVTRAFVTGGAAAAAFAHAPAALIYVFTGLMSVAGTAFRPAEAAYTPALARTPEELSAANVIASTIESVGIFAGPAIGGLLLAVANAATVFAFTAATVVASAVLIARIRPQGDSGTPPERRSESVAEELLAGIRTIGRDRRLRILVGLFSAQTFIDGLLGVIVVVFAFKLLHAGTSMVGFLNAAVGVGGVVGAFAAAALIGRGRLAGDFGIGVALFGLPLALAAAWSNVAFALFLMGLVGVGNTLADVSGTTLLQRSAPDVVLARVFGLLESLFLITVGIGAILAAPLVAVLGTRGAMVVTGVALPGLVLLTWPLLRPIDRAAAVPERRLELLRGISIFAALPEATLERLAGALRELRVSAGAEIVRQGEAGDRFYIVDQGSVEVAVDGAIVSTLGPGGYFGEIALLREVPRTASVRARDNVVLLSLGRDDFIPAVTGSAASLASARSVVGMRLGGPHG